MTKKMNKKIEKAEQKVIATVTGNELKNYMEQYSNVSLRKLSDVTGISYAWLLKSSKKPIVGETYNPEAVNYMALAEVMSKREIHLADLPWVEMDVENRRNGGTGKLSKNPEDFPIGSRWYLRGMEVQVEVVYETATNVVVLPEESTIPMNLSWATFFQKGPSSEKHVVKEKKSEKEGA